jgi:hypothetical protein
MMTDGAGVQGKPPIISCTKDQAKNAENLHPEAAEIFSSFTVTLFTVITSYRLCNDYVELLFNSIANSEINDCITLKSYGLKIRNMYLVQRKMEGSVVD